MAVGALSAAVGLPLTTIRVHLEDLGMMGFVRTGSEFDPDLEDPIIPEDRPGEPGRLANVYRRNLANPNLIAPWEAHLRAGLHRLSQEK